MKGKAVWVGLQPFLELDCAGQCLFAALMSHQLNSLGCEDVLLEHLHHRFLWNRVLLWLHGFETGILSHSLCSSVHCKFRSQTKGRENEREERSWRYLLLMFPSLPYSHLSLLPFLSHQVIQVINAHVRKGRVGHKSLRGEKGRYLKGFFAPF